LTDLGINSQLMEDTATAIQPGTTALFVLTRKVTADMVLEALRGEGGTALKTSRDHTKEAALQTAPRAGLGRPQRTILYPLVAFRSGLYALLVGDE
jgi:uncharacterized membrane protein